MNNINIKVILASVRKGRFGDKPAKWIVDLALQTKGVSVELLDIKEYILPIFAEAVSPAYVQGALDDYANSAKNMLEQLVWWVNALKEAREIKKQQQN